MVHGSWFTVSDTRAIPVRERRFGLNLNQEPESLLFEHVLFEVCDTNYWRNLA